MQPLFATLLAAILATPLSTILRTFLFSAQFVLIAGIIALLTRVFEVAPQVLPCQARTSHTHLCVNQHIIMAKNRVGVAEIRGELVELTLVLAHVNRLNADDRNVWALQHHAHTDEHAHGEDDANEYWREQVTAEEVTLCLAVKSSQSCPIVGKTGERRA